MFEAVFHEFELQLQPKALKKESFLTCKNRKKLGYNWRRSRAESLSLWLAAWELAEN